MQNLMPPIDTTDHAFHDGDPTTGQLGTIVTAAWLNDVQGATRDIQAEIIAVLTKAGIQPNPQKQNQLAEAISQIIGSGGYATSGDLTLGLSKKIDKADIAQQLGNDTTKVPSLQLVTTELGKKASVADANSKLAKDKNGADIPDKEAFIGNLGLGEKFSPLSLYGRESDGSAKINTPSGAVSLSFSYNGYLGVVGKTGDVRLSFSPAGVMESGVVPVSRLSGLSHESGDSKTAVMSQYGVKEYAAPKSVYSLSSDNSASIKTPSGREFNVSYNGFSGVKNEKGTPVWEFNPEGVLSVGKIPASNVTGLQQIGVGQSWRNVQSQRSIGTLYTNSTGRPIFVSVSIIVQTTKSSRLYVDGVTVASAATQTGDGVRINMSVIVPAGSTYRVDDGESIQSWAELS